jgi:hypothetical protein
MAPGKPFESKKRILFSLYEGGENLNKKKSLFFFFFEEGFKEKKNYF